MSKKVKRLFNEFKPTNYELHLEPNRNNATFKGTVTTTGKKAGRPSKRITLHQKDLKIISALVTRHDKKGSTEFEIDRINLHANYDEVRIHTRELLYPGEFTVQLEFEGKLTDQMNGMYPCRFKHEGIDKQLIATQFESHHAREVFPCVDEPEAKATFDLTIVTPKGELVVANTPVKRSSSSDRLTTTTFETTPVMSTYLLAFVYGDMGYTEAKTKDGVVVRAYATPDNVQFTDFALDVAVKCLDFYNDYFGIPYPLEKCDMIALPDFASGAMENWGCITYREQCMLVDPKNTSIPTKQYVAMVVAHELAHQWFGNLVTMRWWTDLWLNEGFASWIEYMAVDHIFPEWQMWTQFAVDEQQRAFKLDALEHTHPIEVAINHPDEIRSIFDTISYSKGASVLHMLHAYLGPEDFRKGLKHYLQTHAHSNTDTIDLWQALEKSSGKPVKAFMHAWTTQSGFPIVRIESSDNKLVLEQNRFFINPKHREKSHTLWPISLQPNSKIDSDLLKNQELSISSPTSTLKLNKNQTGFFRVAYDNDHLVALGKQIKDQKLSPLDRLGILSDVFEGAKAGFTPTTVALEFLSNFTHEDNSAVWDVMAASIGSTRAVMDDETLRENMKPFIRNLGLKQYERLSWETKPRESYFDQLLRPTILGLMAGSDHTDAVNEALRRFDAAKQLSDINPDSRSIIFHTVTRTRNDQKTFDRLLEFYVNSNLSEEKTVLASALTSFKAPALYNQALELIKTDKVRAQDIAYWVVYSFSNRFSRKTTWEWMTSNWRWLEKTIGSDLSFYRFPLYAANAFSDSAFIPEFRKFFDKHSSAALQRSIDQAVETLEWQSEWKKRDLASVKKFFKA